MTKLNQNQLQEVKAFIQKRGFTYIDVQMEILDHVATRVEEKMSENSGLDLKTALDQTHAEFGVNGFSTIEDSIVKGLAKKYRKFFWKELLHYFGPKYILLVLFSCFSLYKIQVLAGNQDYIYGGLITVLLVFSGVMILLRMNDHRYRKYMSYKISGSFFGMLGAFFIFLNMLMSKHSDLEIYGINRNFALASIILTIAVIYLTAAFKTMRFGMKESEQLRQLYQ